MEENNKPILLEDAKRNPDMFSQELDRVTLDKKHKVRGIILFLLCSALGIWIFFGNINVGGESQTVFGFLYNSFTGLFGSAVYWIVTAIIIANLIFHIYFRYIKKGKVKNPLADTYNDDSIVKTILFILGALYAIAYTLHHVHGVPVTEVISGEATGGNVFPPIVIGVFGIVLVGAICMPLLLNYGILEIVGAILEPLMRPLFKVPGKAALDATASFVSSSSVGVLITNRLWRQNVYTEREMVAIMTGFSAVSIGFAQLVINTAGVGDSFASIYAWSFVMVFIIEMILVRIWPINKKRDIYHDGSVQTDADRKGEAHYTANTIPRGIIRGVKRAAISRGVPKDIKISFLDSAVVLAQVLAMLSAIGLTGMILAEYTPVFKWLGYIFLPLMKLCQVPDAALIAPSVPVGIAEMFLPVLVMTSAAKTAVISYQARVFICLVSMSQIIFFSETGTVMLATKSPIKFWELLVGFIERTIIAIPLAAIIIHAFF